MELQEPLSGGKNCLLKISRMRWPLEKFVVALKIGNLILRATIPQED